MTAPHFFLAPGQIVETGGEVLLDADDSRHALRSLRLRRGEAVTLADGSGRWAAGVVAAERDGRAVVEVREERHVDRPEPRLTVAMAPPKGDRLSWAVQKLAEIGVDRLEIVETERTVRAWSAERAERALERLRTVSREAAMQSRRPFLMEVEQASLAAGGPDGASTVVLWEEAETGLPDVLANLTGPVRLVVGPEGGFTEEEISAAMEGGAAAASLGPAILRTETAAVVGAALVLARFGRLG